MLQYVIVALLRRLRSSARATTQWFRFWRSYHHYTKLTSSGRAPKPENLYPCLGDDTGETPVDPVYFYQDAWAFRKIVQGQPTWHMDVGSHHKFVALLSTIIPVTMVDIRPLPTPLDTLTFKEGSILALPFEDGSVPSVSSICVVEHIGLGRYGDPLDPDGTEKAIAELKRVVQPGGDLYLSLPLDDENRTYFNAHRAFRETYVLDLFQPFEVVERRYIFGMEFLQGPRSGFGVGCYHLRRHPL